MDETPEEACLRELNEETGLEGKIVRLLGVYSQPSVMYKNVLIIGFEVDATGVPAAGSDSLSVRFFMPPDLPEVAFPSHREMIADGIKGLR
jgi:8-oxo-dGTP diphosphatase